MDYLKTWGSAAVSTIVSKSGLNLPFTLGPKVYTNPIWTLYEGMKRVCLLATIPQLTLEPYTP